MSNGNTPVVVLGRNAYRLVQGDIQILEAVDQEGNFRYERGDSWAFIDLDDWNNECEQAMAMLGGVATRHALDRLSEFAQNEGSLLPPAASAWVPYLAEADKALAESARARPL